MSLPAASESDSTYPTSLPPSSSSRPTLASTSIDQRNHPSSESDPTEPVHSFELDQLVLVTTLDGQLHALDRNTGTWNWTLSDPSSSSNALIHPFGLVKSQPVSRDPNDLPDESGEEELYAIEPQNDGNLYVFSRSSGHSSRLEKLPLSVSQLVNLSPFTFPTDSSKMFVGKKESSLIGIDLRTGAVVSVLHADSGQSASKGKGKAKAGEMGGSFGQSNRSPAGLACPLDPAQENVSRRAAEDEQIIEDRPRDVLYIGRTDYRVSIYSKPNTLVQTLRYSTYTPSNLGHSLQSLWTRTPDELYLEPTHDGNLVCFQATPRTDPNSPGHHERGIIKWQNSFGHPVTSVFDVVFPNVENTSFGENGRGTAPGDKPTQDPGPSKLPSGSKTTAPKRVSVQQPVIFVQPKFLPSKDDGTHRSGFSSDDEQFNLFHALNSQTPFARPAPHSGPHSDPKRPLPAHRRAFLGKYEQSFYVMSQNNYPLVAFAPSAYQALGQEPSVGIHNLLDSRLSNQFAHHARANRLLDPITIADGLVEHSLSPSDHHHPRLALDPPPTTLTLPPPEQPSEPGTRRKFTLSNILTSAPAPSGHDATDQLASGPATSAHLHQRAARISSLIVRTFKDQLMPAGPGASQSADDRLLELNPVVTILFVLVFVSWWASRKVGPQSVSRWDHLHRLVHRSLSSHSPADDQPQSGLENVRVAEFGEPPTAGAAAPTLTTIPITEADSRAGQDGQGDGADMALVASALPASKLKPKRRRGKRPGQKAAAAAAAKAEAEADAAAALSAPHHPLLSSPSSGSDDLAVSAKRSGPEKRRPLKPKPTLKKKRSTVAAAGVARESEQPQAAELLRTAVGVQFALDEALDVDEFESFSNGGGLQPHRVGSLMVTNETIGYGSHGTVVLKGTFQGRQVAVKRLLKDFVTLAMHEVTLLQESDDHPNVVRYFVKESLDNFLYIALELCNASLYDLIERRQAGEHDELTRVFNPKKALKQITAGLRYLHRLKIVHRDIKPQNILISLTRAPGSRSAADRQSVGARPQGFRMLISDFGLCKKLDVDESSFAQTANHAAGSFGYRAPEILRGQVDVSAQGSSTASSSVTSSTATGASAGETGAGAGRTRHRLTRSIDVFSLGCIFYYVLTKGEHPFGSKYEREVNILKGEPTLEQLDGLDEEAFEAQQLVRAMVRANACDRPTAEQVLQNPYFWDPAKRLTFLCDASDRFEIMDREPPGPALLGLEDQSRVFKHIRVTGGSRGGRGAGVEWCRKVDRVLVENLGKYRKYDGDSVRDLLRVMRNKKHHFQDLPDNLKRTLGNLPDGFLGYFSKRFPWLVCHVYGVVEEYLSGESMFGGYFEVGEEM